MQLSDPVPTGDTPSNYVSCDAAVGARPDGRYTLANYACNL